MFRVAYRSTLDGGVGEAEILSIADQSAQANGAAGLTGAWLLSGRRCLGALEGDPRILRGAIETIWDDPRHSSFEILDMRSRVDPAFDWPFLLVRAETFQTQPDLAAHPGLSWLAEFDGGMSVFFGVEDGERASHGRSSD